jgi:hypothetical protein
MPLSRRASGKPGIAPLSRLTGRTLMPKRSEGLEGRGEGVAVRAVAAEEDQHMVVSEHIDGLLAHGLLLLLEDFECLAIHWPALRRRMSSGVALAIRFAMSAQVDARQCESARASPSPSCRRSISGPWMGTKSRCHRLPQAVGYRGSSPRTFHACAAENLLGGMPHRALSGEHERLLFRAPPNGDLIDSIDNFFDPRCKAVARRDSSLPTWAYAGICNCLRRLFSNADAGTKRLSRLTLLAKRPAVYRRRGVAAVAAVTTASATTSGGSAAVITARNTASAFARALCTKSPFMALPRRPSPRHPSCRRSRRSARRRV